jgi:hypothetical protein
VEGVEEGGGLGDRITPSTVQAQLCISGAADHPALATLAHDRLARTGMRRLLLDILLIYD